MPMFEQLKKQVPVNSKILRCNSRECYVHFFRGPWIICTTQ
jgi:hypothetical protein